MIKYKSQFSGVILFNTHAVNSDFSLSPNFRRIISAARRVSVKLGRQQLSMMGIESMGYIMGLLWDIIGNISSIMTWMRI